MANRPKKLKRDGITEALFEVRFSTAAFPEVYVGRLVAGVASFEEGMAIERLPLADLPAPMRRADPALAYQATLQLKNRAGTRIGRIGETVISWHVLAPYPGWGVFQPEIARINDLLSASVEGLTVQRVGFRYLNFMKSKDHHVEGLKDITLDVSISGKVIDLPVNLAYERNASDHKLVTRIATPEFIPSRPEDVSLVIDIDVHSEGKTNPTPQQMLAWVENAHTLLKEEFFTLLKPEIMKTLIEE